MTDQRLCTKNVHLTFDNQVYQQKDSQKKTLLGPVLTGISMVELETQIVPTLENIVTMVTYIC